MTLTTLLMSNNAGTTLAAPVAIGDTSITLATGTGSKFPLPDGSGTQFFPITLIYQNAGIAVNEITYCTARSGDVCTEVLRGREGTAQRNWAVGDIAANLLTASSLTYLGSDLTGYVTFTNTGTFTNKTFDTSGSGNHFSINGHVITGINGGGPNVVLDSSPSISAPQLLNVPILSLGSSNTSFWLLAAAGSDQGSATSVTQNVVIVNSGSGGILMVNSLQNGYLTYISNVSSGDINVYPRGGYTMVDGITSTIANQPLVLKRGSYFLLIQDTTNSAIRVLFTGQQQVEASTTLPVNTGITAGTSSGTAGSLLAGYNKVTSTAGGVSAIMLPSAPGAGTMVWIYNRCGSTLTIYPTGAGTLYWIGNDAGSSTATCAEGSQIWINDGGDNWVMMSSTGF